jgi:hypothetical protein
MKEATRNKRFPRLQRLIGAAGLDGRTRFYLLSDRRRETAMQFDLSEQELKAVVAVAAHSFQGLADGLIEWMEQQQ